MSHPDPSSAAGAPVPTCGACGATVTAADVTCPVCGVLLAAYQAPAGATGVGNAPAGDTSATRKVNRPVLSSPMAPPPIEMDQGPTSPPEPAASRHRPRSQSPIGDALRRSRADRATGPDELGSAAIADELARMATNDSALAREVEAELTGAKVTFDRARAVIETEQVDVTHSGAGAPVVSAHAPVAPAPEPNAPAAESEAPAKSGPGPGAPSTSRAAAWTPTATIPPAQRPATTGLNPATVTRWLPFILIGCAVLGIGRSLAGVGALPVIVLGIGLVYLLVKVASASSRKTTTMPRDESWKAKPPRRRK